MTIKYKKLYERSLESNGYVGEGAKMLKILSWIDPNSFGFMVNITYYKEKDDIFSSEYTGSLALKFLWITFAISIARREPGDGSSYYY